MILGMKIHTRATTLMVATVLALTGCAGAHEPEPKQRNLVDRAPECFDPATVDKRGCPDFAGVDPTRRVKSITLQDDGSLRVTYEDGDTTSTTTQPHK